MYDEREFYILWKCIRTAGITPQLWPQGWNQRNIDILDRWLCLGNKYDVAKEFGLSRARPGQIIQGAFNRLKRKVEE